MLCQNIRNVKKINFVFQHAFACVTYCKIGFQCFINQSIEDNRKICRNMFSKLQRFLFKVFTYNYYVKIIVKG